MRGLHLRKPGKTLSHIEPMNTKIDELFATLRILITDQARDLAMAMAERDKLRIERDEGGVRADFADLAAERRGDELEKLRILHRDAVAGWNKAAIERDNARQSLRAAEQEVAEMEADYADLRTVNARLIAERDAAMERLNHAESILMQ